MLLQKVSLCPFYDEITNPPWVDTTSTGACNGDAFMRITVCVIYMVAACSGVLVTHSQDLNEPYFIGDGA